jgi:two-component system cell cycle sensor histidine kinase/response regulator CckA
MAGKPSATRLAAGIAREARRPTLLKEMRRANPDLKMIFVSGYAEEALQKNLPPSGQFAFLRKPFTLKQLVATVNETMTAE